MQRNPSFHTTFWILSISLLTFACSTSSEQEDYVARVHDKYLTRAALSAQIPATASIDDSLKRAKVFINSWVRERVLLEKAEFNLNKEEPRFQEKVERYLNDLLIYEYEQQLVSQKLDTQVTLGEMMAFYEMNKQNFILKDYVVKARYIIAPEELDDIERMARRFREYDENDSLKVLEYVVQNSLEFWDEPDTWVFVPQLLEKVPINFSYFEEKVKIKNYFDKTANGNRYLLYVTDFKVRDGETPFELEKERIKSIILNQRKSDLLRDMRDGLFKEALEAGHIEIKE